LPFSSDGIRFFIKSPLQTEDAMVIRLTTTERKVALRRAARLRAIMSMGRVKMKKKLAHRKRNSRIPPSSLQKCAYMLKNNTPFNTLHASGIFHRHCLLAGVQSSQGVTNLLY
jgi:predicted 2-oxoglutarate/Fe(II)-dependent dioxygenase YbiX